MKAEGIIFDLDGTLWDATNVTAETWVEVLARHPEARCAQFPDLGGIKKYMGLTNEELATVFFPEMSYEDAYALMMESCALENEYLPTRGGILYPHVKETLDELKSRGLRLFIVSNCQDGYIEAFLTAHRLHDRFDGWECSGRSGKGKAENITDIIRRHGLKNPVYVGDTISDYNGARGSGIPFVYAKYGFGEENGRGRCETYDRAINDISELCGIIE